MTSPRQAFDEAGRPVGSVDFDYAGLDGETSEQDEARIRQQTLRRLLHFLTVRGGPKAVGQRALVLAFIAGATSFRTQRELARRMGIKPSRASKIVNFLRRELAQLASEI